jgi:hypothetical protein
MLLKRFFWKLWINKEKIETVNGFFPSPHVCKIDMLKSLRHNRVKTNLKWLIKSKKRDN